MKRIQIIFFFTILILCPVTCIAQWVALNSGTSMNLNSIQFINSQTGFVAGNGATFRKTTDGGNTWEALDPFAAIQLNSIYFFNSTTGLICGNGGLIAKTTDGGYNFITINTGTSNSLYGLSFYNSQIGACAGNSGTILYSTNGGDNWSVASPTGYLVTFYSSCMVDALTGYSVGVNTIFSPLVAKTTNGGSNWTYSSFMVNNNEATLYDIHLFDSQNGIAVSNLWNGTGGISITTNGGVNWTSQIYTYGLFGIDFPTQSIGYSVGLSGYILKSTDAGISWIQQTGGTASNLRAVDFTDSFYGFAVGSSGTILKTTNGGLSALHHVSSSIPGTFYLYQNYPNPFNPATKIKFDIPFLPSGIREAEGVMVRLVICNILGSEIAKLVNEPLIPGSYEIEWDASRFPSGIYFYKLNTESFSETKRMVLLK